MNKFECIGVLDEVSVKAGGYTTKKWMDGKKTNEDISVKTYRGKFTMDVNGHSMTLKVDVQDKSIFCRNGNQPRANKSYDNIGKLLTMAPGTKVRVTGEVIDGCYYSAKKDEVVENVDFRADFVNAADADATEECFLNTIARFGKNYSECLTEDGAPVPGKEDVYRMEAWITPDWGKRYFPIRSSYKDKFVYVSKENFEGMMDLISDDGETPERSMKITFSVKFIHKGGAAKKVASAGGFGNSRAVSTGSGWDEMELWIDGGDYYEPEYEYNDEGEEVLKNANLFITREDLRAASAAYKEKKGSLKEDYMAWKNASAVKTAPVDDDDAF